MFLFQTSINQMSLHQTFATSLRTTSTNDLTLVIYRIVIVHSQLCASNNIIRSKIRYNRPPQVMIIGEYVIHEQIWTARMLLKIMQIIQRVLCPKSDVESTHINKT